MQGYLSLSPPTLTRHVFPSRYYGHIAPTRRSAQFVLDCIDMGILRTEA